MNGVLSYFTRGNSAVFLILLLVAVAIEQTFAESLSLATVADELKVPIGALVVAGGLSTIQFKRAQAGESVLAIAVVLVIVYALVGAVQVVFTNDLPFSEYISIVQFPAAGVAVGKGLFANNT